MEVNVTVNGTAMSADIEPRMLLVHLVRDEFEQTGTHWGCDTSNCGACVVLMDGLPVKSCTVLGVMAEGRTVETVEGMETADGLDPIQAGFMACHGLQCGFCTPGMMLVGKALLKENPNPSEHEIREAISGQLCRCTGYDNIVKSIQWAADHQNQEVSA
jgi:aerobic carbon-monoxide dehydrogenase small subunit